MPPGARPEFGVKLPPSGRRRRTARDGHVLDLMDVVAPAGAACEADQHVGRQHGEVVEHLRAVHGDGNARRGGRHHEVVHGVAQGGMFVLVAM